MSGPNLDSVQGWMLDIAGAASGDTHNLVFVMRKALTAAYQQGFDDGHRAADRDRWVRRHIDDVMRKEDPR